jgi:hypothetical protein
LSITRLAKKKFHSFADETSAREKAGGIAAALSRGEAVSLTLTGEDRLAYARALELLRPTGLSIDAAAMQLAEVHKKLNRVSLLDAVEYYVKRNPHSLPQKIRRRRVQRTSGREDEGRAERCLPARTKSPPRKVLRCFSLPDSQRDGEGCERPRRR